MPAQRILFGLGNQRQEFDVPKLVIRLGVVRRLAHRSHCAACKRRAKIWLADLIVQRDDAVAARRAEAFLASGDKAQKLHCIAPSGVVLTARLFCLAAAV